MIEWLRAATRDPSVEIGGRTLPVAIRRHARARRLTMRLAPDGSEVRITLPTWGRTIDAMVFVDSRRTWLEHQLAAVPVAAPPAVGGTVGYRGEALAIAWDARHPRRPSIGDGLIAVGGPAETVGPRLRRWLEGEALRLLAADLADYCARADVAQPVLRLSRAQRRWGSCSGKGCIRINWRLVQAPDPVRRSVVAHEVAHLVHFDHSPAFHTLLGQLYDGEIGEADAWLKREGRGLYAAFG
ncbi:MAG: YgjP-like metallopeptidase domain-containing protein [Croceibacterium sp.]